MSYIFGLDNVKGSIIENTLNDKPLNPPPVRPPRKNSPSMKAKNERTNKHNQVVKSTSEIMPLLQKEKEDTKGASDKIDSSKNTVGHLYFLLSFLDKE